jgi:sugar lactone lactonase YvrE
MASSLSSFTHVAIAVEPDDAALYAVTDAASSGPCALSHPTCSNIYGFQASAETPAATFDIGLSYLNLNGIALTSSSVVVQSPYAGSTFLYKYSRSALKAAVQSSAGVVDESSGTQVAAANTSAALSGLAADSETSGGRAGIAYFASTAGIYADTASLGSSTQVLTQGGMSSPAAVAVDSAGDVYVADSTTNAIHMWQAFPADGLQPAFATLSGTAIGQPVSLATDSYNNLYVGNLAKDTITVYKALTAPGAQNPAPFLTINLPSGADPYQIALDAQNRLYVSDPDHSAVYIYNAGSTAIAQTLSVPELPTGIAVSPTGNVYVYVNYGGGYIFAYAPSGSALSTEPYQEIGTGLGASEGYLAIDANGTIYAQSPYQIRAFAQTGTALGPIGVTNVGFGTFAGLAVYAPKL